MNIFFVFLMVGQCLADLTCYDNGNFRDKDGCRAPDFNTAFNGAMVCINPGGVVSKLQRMNLFCFNGTCVLLPVYGEHAHSLGFAWLCLFFLSLLHSSKPEMLF